MLVEQKKYSEASSLLSTISSQFFSADKNNLRKNRTGRVRKIETLT